MSFSTGTYVCLLRSPESHKGTVTGISKHKGRLRYIFHIDERITAISFPDIYAYDQDLVACTCPTSREIARINELLHSSGA